MRREAINRAVTGEIRTASEPGPIVRWLVIGALCVLFLGTLAGFAARPADGVAFAVIVPPSMGQPGLFGAIAAADGTLVRESRFSWLAIAAPRTDRSAADFRAALQDAGVIVTLHPALLAGCFEDFHSNDSSRTLS